MQDLLSKIAEVLESGKSAGEIRMCQINSGLFGVPWEQSKRVIQRIEVDKENQFGTITAYSLA
jgi:ADP-ribose 1''-phosphate phosphatase